MTLPRPRTWYIFTGILLGVYAVVSVLGGRNPGVSIFGSLVQQSMLLAAVVFLAVRIKGSEGREQAFWLLISLSVVLWCVSQLEWVVHEVWLRTPVPNVSWGDLLLFFHPVPLLAALLVRPSLEERDSGEHEQFTLDFAIPLLWWVYLYSFAVLAWELPSAQHLANTGKAFTFLYLIENLTVLVIAGVLFTRSLAIWRSIYRNLMLASGAYVLCSWMVHYRVFGFEYYTGCLYDLPLVASISLTGSLGLIAREGPVRTPEAEGETPSPWKWTAGIAAAALISIPALALWSLSFSDAPQQVSDFRLTITFVALAFVALLVLQKQRLLNRQLRRMLGESEGSLARQKQLQDRLVESGKMAALGQLVAGIAHEINNPLAAIVGYSDILETGPGAPEEARDLGRKIGKQARRTKIHVESMLNFARQSQLKKRGRM